MPSGRYTLMYSCEKYEHLHVHVWPVISVRQLCTHVMLHLAVSSDQPWLFRTHTYQNAYNASNHLHTERWVSPVAVYITANVSGGHLNPAVTFATCLTGHTSWAKGGLYVIAQVLGGIFGSLMGVSHPWHIFGYTCADVCILQSMSSLYVNLHQICTKIAPDLHQICSMFQVFLSSVSP